MERAGQGCPRGGRCWLHFAVLAWVFWNGHVQRYADARFRVESDLAALIRRAQMDVATHRTSTTLTPAADASALSYLFARPGAVRRPSTKHKAHREYRLADVAALDAGLAHEVRLLAAALGYRHTGDPPTLNSAATDSPPYDCEGGT